MQRKANYTHVYNSHKVLTAVKTTARIDFLNPPNKWLIVPEAVWWEIEGKSPGGYDRVPHAQHEVDIADGDDQYFVLAAKDQQGQIIPYKDANEPLEALGKADWDIKLTVTSENVGGFEITLTMAVTRAGLASRGDFKTKQQRLLPRLESIAQSTLKTNDDALAAAVAANTTPPPAA